MLNSICPVVTASNRLFDVSPTLKASLVTTQDWWYIKAPSNDVIVLKGKILVWCIITSLPRPGKYGGTGALLSFCSYPTVKIGSKHSLFSPSCLGRRNARMTNAESEAGFHTHAVQLDYDIDWFKSLGSGVSGPVRLCRNKASRQQYALKILLDRPKARKEATLHRLCSASNHVVKVIDAYVNDITLPGESAPKRRILLVMELMEGGELFEYITKRRHFTEREASAILLQIARAVQHCHRLNIAHRDIKPENLLLLRKTDRPEEVCVKLADFGFAKVDNGDLTTPQYTPYYVAPQVLEAQRRQREAKGGHAPPSPYYYDRSCDMWSVGVILYIMLCGYPPFYSDVPNQPISQTMKTRIMKGDFDFPTNEWKAVSDTAKDLVRKLLCVDPHQRIGIEELVRHPWLSSSSVPTNDLPSPGIMLDRDSFEQAKAVHSEFLQGMRGSEDSGFFLKPIVKSKNKLLTNRQRVNGTISGGGGSGNQLPSVVVTVAEVSPAEEGLTCLKQLRDFCLMPPPASLSVTNLDDPVLVEGVKRSLTFNECHRDPLLKMLQTEGWDGTEFVGSVNRQRLANAIQQFLESLSATSGNS